MDKIKRTIQRDARKSAEYIEWRSVCDSLFRSKGKEERDPRENLRFERYKKGRRRRLESLYHHHHHSLTFLSLPSHQEFFFGSGI